MHGLLIHKNIRIPLKKNRILPLPSALCYIRLDKGEIFQKLSWRSETLGMTSIGLVETFKGDFADSVVKHFCWCRWGPSGGSSVRRPGSEDPIGASGNNFFLQNLNLNLLLYLVVFCHNFNLLLCDHIVIYVTSIVIF